MKKFGFKDQIGYVFGDMAGSFVNLYVESFFLVYCTYVMGITPAFMGTFFIFSRIWDAINDPLIGSLPDRWKIGKTGDKFKPYIRVGMIPLAVAGMLAFAPVYNLPLTARHIIVCVAYVLVDMTYTLTSMPYGSLVSVITTDPVERTKLSRARSIGGMIVGMGFLSFVPQFIFDKNSNPIPDMFFKVAFVFGLLSIIFYLGLLFCTTERVKTASANETHEKFNYWEVIRGCLKNRPLIGAMVATVGSLISITGGSAIRTYMFKEYYHDARILTAVSLSSLPVIILCFILVPILVKKFGKRKTLLGACIPALVVSAFLFIVPIPNVWLYFALSIIGNMGNSVFTILVWSLVADCIDFQEYQTHDRKDGSVFSVFGFARKIGSAIASAISAYALGWVGFVAGQTQQTQEVANNIRTLATFIPLLTAVLMLIGIGLIFNLTKEDSEKITEELQKRHAEKMAQNAAQKQ
ncbi:MAG: glycoside-pentoside-hexuronide (GPH):cation symporter [Ruthenibacterium sp.]